MTTVAKLFFHDNGQAVQLSDNFHMPGNEVHISKIGDKIVLEPIKTKFDVKAWRRRLDELGARDFLPDGIPYDPPLPPDLRKFFDE